MMIEKTSTAKNTSCQATLPNAERINGTGRLKMALIGLLALMATGLAINQFLETQNTANSPQNELYMPIADPVLEPNRPDLIGDSLPNE